ncbi:Trimeric GatFAB AmidoTransferase(AdT) complex subunit [Saitoella coloradoensis]
MNGLLRVSFRRAYSTTTGTGTGKPNIDFTHFYAGDTILLRSRKPPSRSKVRSQQTRLVGPLQERKSLQVKDGLIKHEDMIGQPVRSTVYTHNQAPYSIHHPTLEDYVLLSERLVTPIYPIDAANIVALLDLHPNPGDTMEVMEAGTGHGALTLYLARAIHAANATENPTSKVHTIDINTRHSKHAESVVAGFRRGMYSKDVEFYAPTNPSAWCEEQLALRASKAKPTESSSESASGNKSESTPESTAEPKPFLSAAVLDLPDPHLHFASVAKCLLPDHSLLVWCPSITQIMACIEQIQNSRREAFIPLVPLSITEFQTNGLRPWDVRSVNVSKEEGGKRIEWVCKPKAVGAVGRSVGGGFVAVFRKVNWLMNQAVQEEETDVEIKEEEVAQEKSAAVEVVSEAMEAAVAKSEQQSKLEEETGTTETDPLSALKDVATWNERTNAFTSYLPHESIQSLAENAPANTPLHGKPIAIKDNICTSHPELPTTCASNILKGLISPYPATVASLLEESGAVIHAKTNMDEFGMGSHSIYSANGPTVNHVNGMEYSAGGSSGGSAVAVRDGMCYAALGTDTGGSVRLPAAYTGIVGFKPTYGLLSRWGVIPYANSLDTVGIMTKKVKDARKVFDVLNVHDPKDPTSLSPTARQQVKSEKKKTWTVGVPAEFNPEELSEPVRKAWANAIDALRSQGHTIKEVCIPAVQQAISAYYILAPAEASSNLAKFDGIRYGRRADQDSVNGTLYANTKEEGWGEEVKRRALLGTFTLSSEAIDNYFIQAQKIRRMIQDDFDKVFATKNPLRATEQGVEDGVDVLITSSSMTTAPLLSEVKKQKRLDAYVNDVLTVPASLAGLPACSVPYGKDERGMPIGLQIMGQFGEDHTVLEMAQILEDMAS